MLMHRITTRIAIVFASLGLATAPVAAQPVRECTNANPTVPAGVSDAGNISSLINELAWRTSHDEYVRILTTDGPVAVLDEIRARGEDLLNAIGPLTGEHASLHSALDARLATIRADLERSPRPTPITVARVPDIGDLRPVAAPVAGQVLFVRNAAGARTRLAFSNVEPLPPIALCAIAHSAYLYLDYLQLDELERIAEQYAEQSRRWDLYIERGYSMTLIERLGGSCRLGPLNYIVATATVSRCRSGTLPPLGPPTRRTIFVHPSAGVAPILRDSSSFRPVSVFEWYGILFHRYRGERLDTWGASIATAFPDLGPRRIGAMVHTPLGKIGVFEARGGTDDWRGRVVLTADVMGWVPGVRGSARDVASPALIARLIPLARTALGR